MKEKLLEFDQMIRQGQVAKVREELTALNRKAIERKFWAETANLARRAGMFLWALRLLKPVIYNDQAEPTVKEKIIYAANLIKIGSFSEAIGLLKAVGERDVDAKLYLAFSHVSQWEYRKAVPLLETYIESIDSPYERCIGEVNLASAYLQVGALAKAQTLLGRIRESTEQNNWRLLHGNSLELSTQLCIHRKDWREADSFLKLMEPLLAGGGTMYGLFYEKWRIIAELMQRPEEFQVRRRIAGLRDQALRVGHGETLRECDSYEAILTHDEELFRKVTFGTPHKSYLVRLLKEFRGTAIPAEYAWRLQAGASPQSIRLYDGTVDGHKAFRCGSFSHKLLTFLSLDFYRPYMIGQLYSHLYPGEYFNPSSSPERVAKVVQRCRQDFKDHGAALAIRLKNQSYILEPIAAVEIVVSKNRQSNWQDEHSLQHEDRIARLKEQWPYQAFSSSQVANVLSLSNRSAQVVLSEAVKKKLVHAQGAGRAKKYFFKKAG